MGAVTSDVTKGPDGLLSHIGLRAGKELDENGDSASLNDDLGLGGRTRRNVGQGPSSLELHQGVGGSQEFDEAADDTGLDDLLNGRVPLLGQKLSELGGGLDLEIDLVGEDTRNHLRKILIQLFGIMLASALVIFNTLSSCQSGHAVAELEQACRTADVQLSGQVGQSGAHQRMWGSVIIPPHHRQKKAPASRQSAAR